MIEYCKAADSNGHLIPNSCFFQMMEAVLDKGLPFRFQASGGSMSPFIRSSDIITIAPVVGRIRCGDVAIFVAPSSGHLIVHRAIRCHRDGCLLKGDNSQQPDGWLPHTSLLGRVVQVEHRGKRVRAGLGWERGIVALCSRLGLLVPLVRWMRKLLHFFFRKKN